MNQTRNIDIPSSDLLRERSIEIRHISRYIDRSKLDESPHRHPFQEIIYIKSGAGKHTIDGTVFNLQPNTIYVIGEGQIHEFLEGSNLSGYLIRYRQSTLPTELSNFTAGFALLQMVTDTNALTLLPDEVQAFESNLEALLSEYEQSKTKKINNVLLFLLLSLLSRINRKVRAITEQTISENNPTADSIFRRFILLIEDNYKSKHILSFYCRQLNMDRRKLTAITSQKTGLTPKDLINKRLMTEAKRMLSFTLLSFKEIAYEIGYSEPAYFSRIFKRKVGVSPKEYRVSQNK